MAFTKSNLTPLFFLPFCCSSHCLLRPCSLHTVPLSLYAALRPPLHPSLPDVSSFSVPEGLNPCEPWRRSNLHRLSSLKCRCCCRANTYTPSICGYQIQSLQVGDSAYKYEDSSCRDDLVSDRCVMSRASQVAKRCAVCCGSLAASLMKH